MSLHLILVEDDRDYAAGLADDLTRLGHRVEHVGDGRQALAALDREQFDAVILDRMMPRLDGLSVVETLRERGLTVPVIMLTALSMASDKVDGLEAGADDYVVKPVAAEELNARINAVLRGRRWTVGKATRSAPATSSSARPAFAPGERASRSRSPIWNSSC